MRILRRFSRRLSSWATSRKDEERLRAEIEAHIAFQTEENIRAGLSAEEARREAVWKFGPVEAVKESYREQRGLPSMETLIQDLRYALRSLRRNALLSCTVVATLAMGIGANTAVFQLVDALLLRNLPVANPGELVKIQIRRVNGGFGIMHDYHQLSHVLLEEIERQQTAFTSVFAWNASEFRIGERAQSHYAVGLLVSGNYFPALAITPAAGRLFTRADDQRGCASPGVVISHGLWQSEFGGQTSTIGRRLVVANRPLEVIGVTPEWFTGLEVGNRFDLAIPVCAAALVGLGYEVAPDVFSFEVLARMARGWTVEQASEHVGALSAGVFEATVPSGYPAESTNRYRKFRLEAVRAANGVSQLRKQYDRALELLLGITSLVLLLACANLANLMLARGAARGREFAVRLALGASRARLIRACLSESVLVAAGGAVAGLALAGLLSRAVLGFVRPGEKTAPLDLSLDWRMLVFSAAAAVLAAAAFGLVPALRAARIDPGVAMKAGGRGTVGDGAGFSFQRAVVVAQVAVSLMLVVGALLFASSFRNLMTLDPGFLAEGVTIASVDASELKLAPAAVKRFQRDVLEEIRSIPLVEKAGTTTHIPVGGGSWSLEVRGAAVEASSRFSWVTPGYFQTLGIPILEGRDFTDQDTESAPKVVVVNRQFAGKFFARTNPIGKTFRTAAEPGFPLAEYQVVGVVPDSRYMSLRDEPPPISYAPLIQHPSLGPLAPVFVRSSANAATLREAIRERVMKAFPGAEIEFRALQDQVRSGLRRDRLMAALAGFFGVLAALLAAVGLYGVMAYLVVQRRGEIGIRMALGAGRGQVAAMVLSDAARMLAAGLVLGAAGALALGQTASSMLFGLKASDPLTFAAAAVLLAVAAGLGCLLPTRRAARLDPMVALRHD